MDKQIVVNSYNVTVHSNALQLVLFETWKNFMNNVELKKIKINT